MRLEIPSLEEREDLAGVVCRRSDLIHNFYAIRREVYLAAPCDGRIKINEHMDHFLRLHAHGSRTCYTPEVAINHHSWRDWRESESGPVAARGRGSKQGNPAPAGFHGRRMKRARGDGYSLSPVVA